MKSMITVGVTAAILAVMLLVSGFLTQTPAQAQQQAAPPDQSASGYLVKAEDGYLTVYQQPGAERLTRTDIDVRTLTEADQETAREGFFVETRQQLAQLLEDLES